jgi:hypothetical protein
VLIAAAVAITAVGLVLVLRPSRDDGAGGSALRQPTPGPQLLATGPLSVRLPAGWSRTSRPGSIPGLELEHAAGARGDGGSLLVGLAPDVTSALLSRAFLRTVAPSGKAPTPANVNLGEGAQTAYRYAGLAPAGLARTVTVFALPTTAGVATVACVSPPQDASRFRATCGRIADSLGVRGARTFAVGPDAQLADRISRTVGALDQASSRLSSARTASRQTSVAAALEKAFQSASQTLRRADVSPADQDFNRRISAALDKTGAAYRELSSSAARRQPKHHRAAAQKIRSAEARVNEILDAQTDYRQRITSRLHPPTIRALPSSKPHDSSTPQPNATAQPGANPTATAAPRTGVQTKPTPIPPSPTPIPPKPTPIPDKPSGGAD